MIPARLRLRYGELCALAAERFPEWEPPPFPPDAAGPQAAVNTNQVIVARLTGRPATRVTSGETVVARERPRGR